MAERGDFPNPADHGVPDAIVHFVSIQEAEVGAVDEELVGLGGVSFFEKVSEGELTGLDGVDEFPITLSTAEDMEEVWIGEDLRQIRDSMENVLNVFSF